MVDRQRVVVDTSVFIGAEAGRLDDRALADLEFGVSVITLGELRSGVLRAGMSPATAAARLATYELAQQFQELPVDHTVSDAWAVLVAQLRAAGRKVPVNDSWIAATALALGVPVATQDADYDDMPGLEVIRV